MSAAKIVLEPIFEAQFLPAASALGPAVRRTMRCRRSAPKPTGAPSGCWTPILPTASGRSATMP